MSNFVMNDSENLYVNSACVTGPTIENLMVGPCVNEEYLEPQFEDSDEKFNERIDQMLREEEDLYDEMIAADRLNNVDYYEHQENYQNILETQKDSASNNYMKWHYMNGKKEKMKRKHMENF